MCNTHDWIYNRDSPDAKIASSKDDWVVFCGTNGAHRSSFYANGVRIPAIRRVGATECSAPNGIAVGINLASATTPPVDFAVAELVTWNRAVSYTHLTLPTILLV